MTTFQLGDDILDSRDVEERIDELEALEADFLEQKEVYDEVLDDRDEYELEEIDQAMRHFKEASDEFTLEERSELKMLRDFRCELEGYCEWGHGETLILDSYFQTYAEQMAKDIGAIDKDAGWPNMFIDWEAAAEALKVDYTEADVDGNTYHARCS